MIGEALAQNGVAVFGVDDERGGAGPAAAIVAVPIAVLLGILAALYRNSLFDRLISMATLSTISFPEFFVAYLLILGLSSFTKVFPSLANISPDADFWEREG